MSTVKASPVAHQPAIDSKSRLCHGFACAVLAFNMLYFFDFTTIFFEPGGTTNRVILLMGLAASAVICALKHELAIKVFRLSWPILPLFIWFWITSQWSSLPGLTVQRSLTLAIVYFTALGIAVGMNSPRGFQVAIFWPACITVMADIISLAFPEISESPIGIKGIHAGKNIAGFVAITCGVIIGFAFSQLGNFARFIAVASVILATIFLVLTESKTNLFVLLIICVMLAVYLFLIHFKEVKRIHLIIACIILAGLFLIGASGTKLSWLGRLYGDPTLTLRTDIWYEMEDLIALSPWKGYGFGAFWSTGEAVNGFPLGYYAFFNDASIVNSGHNGYLDLLLQGGRPALFLAYVAVAQAICCFLILVTSPAVATRHKWTFCMLNCLIMMTIVQNLTESSMFFPSDTSSYIFLNLIAQLVRWRADLI